MPDLLTLIGALYACNMLAEQGPLTRQQITECGQFQEAVKMRFLTSGELEDMRGRPLAERYAIALRGYERFKVWEMENPDTVRRLRGYVR
ncbi:hypothetical protein [Hoeflea poritis]|uniref:Uncharacterized protein n=1 Tax=Hoeflea poritis TaxID=2993659 RepID=A0ABT4VPW3_9HYPH|nr:hypothetical protein [Hoeflea poritis]MDA4846752.1 hypothetical protein [Hoeflea poritis]